MEKIINGHTELCWNSLTQNHSLPSEHKKKSLPIVLELCFVYQAIKPFANVRTICQNFFSAVSFKRYSKTKIAYRRTPSKSIQNQETGNNELAPAGRRGGATLHAAASSSSSRRRRRRWWNAGRAGFQVASLRACYFFCGWTSLLFIAPVDFVAWPSSTLRA